MFDDDIYNDMAQRSGGEIYIGVVGPVRTGKSTLIKRFMKELVLPYAEDAKRAEMTDELPQSASGKTVMTTEPKFIPAKAVEIHVGAAKAFVRFADCVGFAVDGAAGFEEDGKERLVKTMWSDVPIPFTQAAAIGTQKVIRDHSTIGICVTTDGSVCGIPRENYLQAEERTIAELKEIGKPFVLVLNCAKPEAESAQNLKAELEQKYGCTVVAVNCEKADEGELNSILRAVLFEFPVTAIDIDIPEWIRVLPEDSSAIAELLERVRTVCADMEVMRDCEAFTSAFEGSRYWKGEAGLSLSLSTGRVNVQAQLKDGVLYDMLTELAGEEITGEGELLKFVTAASQAKRSYEKIKDAFECAKVSGYGIVCPDDSDLSLEKPKLVKQGQNVGIKLKATAPSYHVVKVDVSGEVSPIMSNAAASEDVVNGIMAGFENDPQGTWNTALFGKSLKSMVKEGLDVKVAAMHEDTKGKMRRTITRIVNEGKGGVICILL